MARTIPSWLMTAAALASIAALAGDPRDAEACSCRPSPSAEAALASSDAVFEARVTTTTAAAAAPGAAGIASTGSEVVVSLTVLRSWKGAGVDSGREVKISTPAGSASCGFNFQQNESYLIYAVRSASGGLATNICMRTKRSADAAADFTALSAGGSGTPTQSPAQSDAGPPGPPAAVDDMPPFEADSGAEAVIIDAGPPPPPQKPPPAAPKGGCAGCAVFLSDAGIVGGIAAALFLTLATVLRRARRR